MADTPAALVNNVLGWKLTDDRSHLLIAFRQPDGNEFVLALTHETLVNAITSLVSALAGC
jgi:hypothetical protein